MGIRYRHLFLRVLEVEATRAISSPGQILRVSLRI